MNVSYERISTADAARIIGVDKTTVAKWCMEKIINFNNVSGGSIRARYDIPEEEAYYIRDLFKKWGKGKAMKHYDKNHAVSTPQPVDNPLEFEVTQKIEELPKIEDNIPTRKPFNLDEVTTTIAYIQDIKERLNDIEAEKNQLTAELEQLRKEVIEYL